MLKRNWIWLLLILIQAVRMYFVEVPKLYQDTVPQIILFGGFIIFSLLFLFVFDKFRFKKESLLAKSGNALIGLITILVLPVALSTFIIMQVRPGISTVEKPLIEQRNKMDRIQIELNAGSFFIHLKTFCSMNMKKPNDDEIERILQDISLTDSITVLELSIDNKTFDCAGKIKAYDRKKNSSLATLELGQELKDILIEEN